MREYANVQRTERKLVKWNCSICGRDLLSSIIESQEAFTFSQKCGYGSVFGDGNEVYIDICQHCMKERLGEFMRSVIMIDCAEWNSLVTETYQRPYDIQQQEGCMARGTLSFSVPNHSGEPYENDTIPEEINGSKMGVNFAAWLKRDPTAPVGDRLKPREIEIFWHRNFYPYYEVIANDLFAKGKLAAGEYVIDIDW